MACRIRKVTFQQMVDQEARGVGLAGPVFVDHDDPVERFNMAEIDQGPPPVATLNRKAIQSLVDHPEEARPIIRNLLRWAKEHGAK